MCKKLWMDKAAGIKDFYITVFLHGLKGYNIQLFK